ncbi:uncharacterized protein MONBRDRAFT_32324 [Monosiga brevicollis MX1]|uniref:Protein kinase domain-containing protein n=1 Tax=Monosiga brevicollis TaxID=81824 RepID=A9UYT0_MONBE|nr:uncharacterized protein MONBRDRAFT_32324 [Monosiga brevicollis MX1]EDQ89516.1 predicted protein [Monosiga brevicollis MX1]|eukprot:XP_001745545.1 hypothetical protein [Monosiga brevicollis MX1]
MSTLDGSRRQGRRSSGFMKTLSRTFSRSGGAPHDDVGDLPATKPTKTLSRRASTGHFHLPEGAIPPTAKPAFGQVATYKKLHKLGEGTYATVFKGISHINGKIVALKEIRLEHEEGAPCTGIREVSLLKGLKHANIVTLHDVIHTKDNLIMVFEFLSKDLKAYMDDCNSYIDLRNAKLFLFQLLRGVGFCHSRKVLHRDLKPQNLLINHAGELKLADFGLARAKSVPIKTYSNEVVTLWYRPPDVLLGSVDYSGDIDMWGVGCIFGEMISGRPMFPGATNADQLELIFKTLGSPSESTWPGVMALPEAKSNELGAYSPQPVNAILPRLDKQGGALLKSLLKLDPHGRVSAVKAMQHPYFNSLGPYIKQLTNDKSIFQAPQVKYHMEPALRMAERRRFETSRRASLQF